MERFNAVVTDAGAIAEFDRHAREQFIGNLDTRTPAPALAGGHGAKRTIVWLTAQRALAGIKRCLNVRQIIHGLLALRR
jgi:hypothetical protein